MIFRKESMKYQKQINYTGNPQKAFDITEQTFLSLGFGIDIKEPDRLVLVNPRPYMSKGMTFLINISKLDLKAEENNLKLIAELKGLKNTILFLSIFIFALAAFFMILFTHTLDQPQANIIKLSLIPLSPWPILIPLFYFFFRYKTNQALNILANNIQQINRSE